MTQKKYMDAEPRCLSSRHSKYEYVHDVAGALDQSAAPQINLA